jgi:flagellar hook-associated protein 2
MVSATGLGSGIDIEGLVTGLVNAERVPAEQRLLQREARVTTLVSAFGTAKSALSDLKSSVADLKDLSSYSKITAKSSASNIVDVSATSSAQAASYQVGVTNLAETQSFASAAYASTATFGTGTLTLTLGTPTYDGTTPDTYNTFTADTTKTAVSVSITSSNNTLSGLRDAINTADAGVSASLIKDGTDFRLLLTTDETGVANSVQITSSNITADVGGADVADLSSFDFDTATTTSDGLQQTRAAENAAFSINGLTGLSSGSNTVTDAVTGVTLTLKNTTTTDVNITISADQGAITSAIDKFVEGYNGYIDIFNQLTDYNATANTRGALQGDFSARSIMSNVRSAVANTVPGLDGSYRSLADIGIVTDAKGQLSVDSTKLNAALAADPDAVTGMFADTTYNGTAVTGVAARLDTILTNYLASDGIVDSRTDSLSKSLSRINDDREVVARRLDLLETRYRAQFNAMDSLLSNITATGDFLTQQLKNLPGAYDGSK